MNELSNRLLTGVSENLANFFKNTTKINGSIDTIDPLDRKIFYVFENSKSKKNSSTKSKLLKT